MKSFKKMLSILLASIMVFSTFSMCITVNAANVSTSDTTPVKIEVTTDKSKYSATGIAKVTVKVTNTGDTALENVSAESLCENLAPINKGSKLTAETEKLNKGDSLSFSFDTTIKTTFKGLNIFNKIGLFFKRLFKTKITVKDNGFNNGREVETYTSTIKFGKFDVPNTVKVWYGVESVSDDNWYKNIDESHVKEHDGGMDYIDNRLIVFFWKDTTEKEKQIVINNIKGKVLGKDETGSEYQIEIQATNSWDELYNICLQVQKMSGVLSCQMETLLKLSDTDNSFLEAIPNDPWKDTFQGVLGTDWNENNPDGLNWWAETIQAPSAWDYNARYSNLKIGIVDMGFDLHHEDLNLNIINPKENSGSGEQGDHGTHVSGVIGATANNEKGITGIVWNKELYCADVKATTEQSEKHISILGVYEGIKAVISKGCKVINFSMGAENPITNYNEVIWNGESAAKTILHYEEFFNQKDFIIVESAGNEYCDSIRNGFFCSITDESIDYMFEHLPEEQKIKRQQYTNNDIYKHIIVAGASDKPSSKGEYTMCSFSNYGDYVSIAAPGKDIFSTILSGGIDGNYGHILWEGTSMAAPMVTGVAALVWSVNPSFTAEEVKEIVCSSYNKKAKGYGSDDRTYPIVNAKLSVEEALRRTSSMIVGNIYDELTNKPIQGVTVKIRSNDFSLDCSTDENGVFSAFVPENRTYKCTLEKEHYQTQVLTAEITKNKIVNFSPYYLSRDVCNFNGEIWEAHDTLVGLTIPDVKITISLIETGTTYVIKTDDKGYFSANVPYGNYKITYEHEGFKTLEETRLISEPDDNIFYISMQRIDNNDDYGTFLLDGVVKFNGHYYKAFDMDSSLGWNYAKQSCEAMGGYLAVITSTEENNFVSQNVLPKTNAVCAYLGGTDEEQEGVWKWVTDEKWEYTNFAVQEPNNGAWTYPEQNYLTIQCRVDGKFSVGLWDDNEGSAQGYVCEWNTPPRIDEEEIEEIKNSFDFLGDATVLSGGVIQLTPLEYWKCGGVWYKNQVNAKSGLKIKFSYWAGGGHDDSYGGADGIVVLFANNTYNLGDAGGALGFVRDSALGVEFDSYCGNWGDPDGKHISIVQNDASNHLQYVLDNRVDDEQWHDVEIQLYNNTINVVLDNKNVLSYSNLENISDTLYVGIAASTGDGYNKQQIKNFTYESLGLENATQSGTCGDNATWSYYENNGLLSISGDGNMYNYVSGGTPWNSMAKSIKEVKIGNEITSIGSYAFSGFENLSSINLNKITYLGLCAFEKCTNLKTLTIPKTLTTAQCIESSASDPNRWLYGPLTDSSVQNIIFEDGMTIIPKHICSRASSIKSVFIPDSVKIIGEGAFLSCTNLKNIDIPYGVTTISKDAFYLSSLTNIVLPDTVTSIGAGAFYYTDISSVTFSKNVTGIGQQAFYRCKQLKNVYYRGNEEDWNKISISRYNGELTTANRIYIS